MKILAKALSDVNRLEAVRKSRLLGTQDLHIFNNITDLVRKSLNVPIAFVSIVEGETQYFIRHKGFSGGMAKVGQIPVRESICRYIIAHGHGVAVGNTMHNYLTRNSRLLRDNNLTAYLGMPLKSDGQVIGTLCVFDDKPREWTGDESETLEKFARFAELEIAAHKSIL